MVREMREERWVWLIRGDLLLLFGDGEEGGENRRDFLLE